MKTVLVTGDVAVDCHMCRTETHSGLHLKWNDQSSADYCERWGGAALLSRLLSTVAGKHGGITVAGPQLAETPAGAGISFLRSFALWELHTKEDGNIKGGKNKVWRVKEFLGMKPALSVGVPHISTQSDGAEIVVIDDANLDSNPNGFCCDSKTWPRTLQDGRSPGWTIWKLWRPNLGRQLGVQLLERNTSPLVLLLSANGLREDGIYISQGVSWERTAQELYTALETKFNSYAKRQSPMIIIVSLGTAGAFLFRSGPQHGAPKAILVYDPKCMEGEWERSRLGQIVGSTTCLVSAITLAIARSSDNPDWELGLKSGLSAMRCLHLEGFQQRALLNPPDGCVNIDFPFAAVAEKLVGDATEELQAAYIPNPSGELVAAVAGRSGGKVETGGRWTILQSKHGTSLYELARNIVVKGPRKSLSEVPTVSYGKLDTADRREIESYRNIFNLFHEYERRLSQSLGTAQPISIAVFGPPGSGKSFGVKQIAKGLLSNVEDITFNLSQFSGPPDLIAALHRVRDSRLRGKLPLVFWDEFDTTLNGAELGWVRYFLQPMQDGTFLEGETVHPVGPAIFVFAGGTRPSFVEFNRLRGHDGYDCFRDAKGPDFVSRLRGYLDILGPNPRSDDPAADPTYVVRRAILFRSILEQQTDLMRSVDELDIDLGVLQAFLTISMFKHGARSMESIIVSSALSGKKRFAPSSLPQRDQLDLHVPAWEFMALVHCTKMVSQERIEQLAQAFHDNYCDALRKRGYKYGPTNSESAKTNSLLVDWCKLPPETQEENRKAVLSIPDKLALSGFVMVPSNGETRPLPPLVAELLAALEHERWLRSKIATGWRYGSVRKNEEKIHDALLPWRKMTVEERAVRFPENPEAVGLDELSANQKEKDRDQISGMIGVLKELGFTVVPSALQETRRAAESEKKSGGHDEKSES